MAISAIISNYNGARFLPKLLESLKAQQGIDLEIIVVDRESKDESMAILQQHPDVKVLSEPPLSGLVCGYACGEKVASHEHLFFCNEDMWFDPNCLALLEKQIDLQARIASADPWQWTYDGKEWIHGATRFCKARWAINGVYPFRDVDFHVKAEEGALVPFACAGAFLIHRQVYNEAGGWDTSFFLDNEDVELFIRTWQRGWKCVTVPSAKVYHAVGMSNIHETGKQTSAVVGKRRYVSNRLGKSVIIWKHFSLSNLWMAFGIFFVVFSNNLVKWRFKFAGWDLVVLGTLITRLGHLQVFRRSNREYNRLNPGERFFTEPASQI